MATAYRAGDVTPAQLLFGLAVCIALAAGAVLLGSRYYQQLPAVNALLNATATLLLVYGYVAIKRRREWAHTIAMLAAFGVSIVFLACYLVYHRQLYVETGLRGRPFTGDGLIRPVYFTILITHVILAGIVPFLAGASIYLGLRERRAAQRRVAVVTFPIWLYVSVTGVVIYLMLYHLYPA